jgi:tetratricopeptide (TPR) repeat protein
MRRRQTRSRQPAELAAGRNRPADIDTDDETPVDEVRGPPPGADPVDYWRDAVLSDPVNVTARRRLAAALLARGEDVLAAEQLEAARTSEPEDVGLIVELAQIQTTLRRFDAAERELRRALRFAPDVSDVHLALGVISFRRGLYTQAEQELKRALELDPESGSAYFYRGEALNQLSRVDEALEMLERAVKRQPENGRAYYVMGILYDKKSRPQEAAAMYRKAREVGEA